MSKLMPEILAQQAEYLGPATVAVDRALPLVIIKDTTQRHDDIVIHTHYAEGFIDVCNEYAAICPDIDSGTIERAVASAWAEGHWA